MYLTISPGGGILSPSPGDEYQGQESRTGGVMQFFTDRTIYDPDGDVCYTPFLAPDGRVGYQVNETKPAEENPRETFIYLNPSDGSDDGVPNVFVYQGGDNDPAVDSPDDHHVVDLDA